jgi:hypothetical protein
MVMQISFLACRHENPHISSNGSPLIVHSEEWNHEEDDVMGKLGENVPLIIDKAVDFMASSQAFMEYLKKSPRLSHVPEEIPEEKAAMFLSD